MKALSIRELPRTERPRERLRDHGAQALSSAELMAILLATGGGGRSALQLGQEVLAEANGSLRRIAAQPIAALTRHPGVGTARALAIHAALELGRRMSAEERQQMMQVLQAGIVPLPRDLSDMILAEFGSVAPGVPGAVPAASTAR